MPITYFEGIKRPCNFTGTQSLVLQGKGEMDDDVYDSPTEPFQLQTFEIVQHFAFVRSRRGSKKKVIGKNPTASTS